MMFDKLCSLYERLIGGRLKGASIPEGESKIAYEECARILSKCALFDMGDGLAHPDLNEEEVESLREGWFMPFDMMAVEDREGCILVSPVDASKRGLKNLYNAIEYRYIFHGGSRLELLRAGQIGELRHVSQVGDRPVLKSSARVNSYESWVMTVGLHQPELVFIDNACLGFSGDSFMDQVQDFHMNAAVALYEIAEINKPNKWVVKKETIKARPIQKGRIPRSDQRPRYVLVTDEELDRVLREPNPENSPIDRRPHRRRRHLRYLKSERYSEEKRFTHTVVEACWVGPQQAEYGGERYTVCLDL